MSHVCVSRTFCAVATTLLTHIHTGLLHCDPHPGNLLRTPDGKLCILDWGMVTVIPENLQLTLIEHMAHLTSRDYAEVPVRIMCLRDSVHLFSY